MKRNNTRSNGGRPQYLLGPSIVVSLLTFSAVNAQVTVIPQKIAFGMTPAELVYCHRRLSVPLKVTTHGKPTRQVYAYFTSQKDILLSPTKGVEEQVRLPDPVLDELQGLSFGTALAAVMRPLGLVFTPSVRDGKMMLTITDFREADESWPVGWPVTEKGPEFAPILFEKFDVEIDKIPLGAVLDGMRLQTGVPMLCDHNGLARKRIDLTTTLVSFPKEITFPQRILRRVLAESRLKYELRKDEADKPFVWISSL